MRSHRIQQQQQQQQQPQPQQPQRRAAQPSWLLSLLVSLALLTWSDCQAAAQANRGPVVVLRVANSDLTLAAVLPWGFRSALPTRTAVLRLASPADGCSSLNFAAGAILLIAHGNCSQNQKIDLARSAGASAVILYDPAASNVNTTAAPLSLLSQPLSSAASPSNFPVLTLFDPKGTASMLSAINQLLTWPALSEPCPASINPVIASLTAMSSATSVALSSPMAGHAGRCFFATNTTAAAAMSSAASLRNCAENAAVCQGILTSTAILRSATLVECPWPAAVRASPQSLLRMSVELVHAAGTHLASRCIASSVTLSSTPTSTATSPWSSSASSTTASSSANTTTAATSSTTATGTNPSSFIVLFSDPCQCVPTAGSPFDAAAEPGLCNLRVDDQWWCQTVGGAACAGAVPLDNFERRTARPCHTAAIPGWGPLSCAAACSQGLGCTAGNQCQCPTGLSGSDCTVPICTRPSCHAQHGTCSAPNTCTCASGYSGLDCSTPVCPFNCRNRGLCTAPGVCECLSGYSGSDCGTRVVPPAPVTTVSTRDTDSSSGSSGGTNSMPLIAGLGAALLTFVLLLILVYRSKLVRPTVIVQDPPEGAELGPIVTRTVVTKRRALGVMHVTERVQDFHLNNMVDANNRMAGLLPSYDQAASRSLSASSFSLAPASPAGARLEPAEELAGPAITLPALLLASGATVTPAPASPRRRSSIGSVSSATGALAVTSFSAQHGGSPRHRRRSSAGSAPTTPTRPEAPYSPRRRRSTQTSSHQAAGSALPLSPQSQRRRLSADPIVALTAAQTHVDLGDMTSEVDVDGLLMEPIGQGLTMEDLEETVSLDMEPPPTYDQVEAQMQEAARQLRESISRRLSLASNASASGRRSAWMDGEDGEGDESGGAPEAGTAEPASTSAATLPSLHISVAADDTSSARRSLGLARFIAQGGSLNASFASNACESIQEEELPPPSPYSVEPSPVAILESSSSPGPGEANCSSQRPRRTSWQADIIAPLARGTIGTGAARLSPLNPPAVAQRRTGIDETLDMDQQQAELADLPHQTVVFVQPARNAWADGSN